jgi:hypothetical protein
LLEVLCILKTLDSATNLTFQIGIQAAPEERR